ncbi:unnamed protein product [Darwinula stevensoni]|uniref:Uncharacterized protein n=1 Tax=Darwinula stevensoni TaxID=69355 RepID=A0A7R8XF45_9CRUS|nr:unnamed protein product [Darwinula stevensoni]CAG0888471.1 unnamed protein product [Darwinula stevensoni]
MQDEMEETGRSAPARDISRFRVKRVSTQMGMVLQHPATNECTQKPMTLDTYLTQYDGWTTDREAAPKEWHYRNVMSIQAGCNKRPTLEDLIQDQGSSLEPNQAENPTEEGQKKGALRLGWFEGVYVGAPGLPVI